MIMPAICNLALTFFHLQVLARAGAVGWIVEVQVIPGDMYELKTTLGHAGYAKYRFILEACRRARARSSQQQTQRPLPQPPLATNLAGGDAAGYTPKLYTLGVFHDPPPSIYEAITGAADAPDAAAGAEADVGAALAESGAGGAPPDHAHDPIMQGWLQFDYGHANGNMRRARPPATPLPLGDPGGGTDMGSPPPPPRTLSTSSRSTDLVETSFLGESLNVPSLPLTRAHPLGPRPNDPGDTSGRLIGAASDLLDYSEIRHLPSDGADGDADQLSTTGINWSAAIRSQSSTGAGSVATVQSLRQQQQQQQQHEGL